MCVCVFVCSCVHAQVHSSCVFGACGETPWHYPCQARTLLLHYILIPKVFLKACYSPNIPGRNGRCSRSFLCTIVSSRSSSKTQDPNSKKGKTKTFFFKGQFRSVVPSSWNGRLFLQLSPRCSTWLCFRDPMVKQSVPLNTRITQIGEKCLH